MKDSPSVGTYGVINTDPVFPVEVATKIPDDAWPRIEPSQAFDAVWDWLHRNRISLERLSVGFEVAWQSGAIRAPSREEAVRRIQGAFEDRPVGIYAIMFQPDDHAFEGLTPDEPCAHPGCGKRESAHRFTPPGVQS